MAAPLSARLSMLWKRRPRSGVAGWALWLAIFFLISWPLDFLPGSPGSFAQLTHIVLGIALFIVLIPLAIRFVRSRMLWSLRNKLVLTYLLIGFAPVVLFVTLVAISAYIAAGQFAIHLADTRLQTVLDQMATEDAGRASRLAHLLSDLPKNASPTPPSGIAANERPNGTPVPNSRLHSNTEAFLDGVPVSLPAPVQGSMQNEPLLGLPPWPLDLHRGGFRGLVLDSGDLYLVTIHRRHLANGKSFTLVVSLPFNTALMDLVAQGLGRAHIFPQESSAAQPAASSNNRPIVSATPGTHTRALHKLSMRDRLTSIAGGIEPPPASIADIHVRFLSTLDATDWDTGGRTNVPIEVDSRPSVLYQQLFGASLGGIVTSAIRFGLIILCIVFAAIELLALIMAIRLSRTMTTSVADLYDATQRIDQGNFEHRIAVARNDQLAELARSFNRMTGSLQRLLEEQQEKERLQNELSIAQEVQANLFPTSVRSLPTLELHGVCRPARSVSGDYYDFLVFHEEIVASAGSRTPIRQEAGVGIALGDISGKGISAALLMATLHSAVRAYRFASEAVIYSPSTLAGLTTPRNGDSSDCGELFESPGRIMELLNRHLYRSTQPEKYATLFLAHYNALTAQLTYSNAGQLPPLLLSRDGQIRRLDKGGTVVGLMDGMRYEEDRFHMRSGDILIAYSDGVTEPENDFGEFGEARLIDVVRRYRDEPLHVISSQVMHALDAWIGAEEQPDDITLVLARQA